MNNITKEKRKEYEINCVISMLSELRRDTSGNPKRLSLTDVAKRHDAKDKYVHTMREMKVLTSQRIEQGDKSFNMYLWNHKGDSIESLAEHIYAKTKTDSKLKEAKKNEDIKFRNKIGKKKLSKICHTSLRAPGTVLAFLEKVYKLCQTLPHEIYHHIKSDDVEETNVNQKILDYLEKSNIIKKDGLIIIWNEDAPSIDMAMLVSEDLKQMSQTQAQMKNKRKESTRTIALKKSIKELLIESVSRMHFDTNPLLRFKSANVKGAIKSLFKYENNVYTLIPFAESIDEKVEALYLDIQKYQNKYLERHKEKLVNAPKKNNKPDVNSTTISKSIASELSKSEMKSLRELDLSEFLTTAEHLKDKIITAASQYKKLLERMNLTDKKLLDDLTKMLS